VNAARWPRDASAERLLVLDGGRGATCERGVNELPSLLEPGDLMVVNDSATLPASLSAVTADGAAVELRLTGRRGPGTFEVVSFGSGDWRTPTESRLEAPWLEVGDELAFGDVAESGLRAHVVRRSTRSDRLLEIRFNLSSSALWQSLYRWGRPVQYAYMRGQLDLWHVQTPYASRPWSVEMPSAGRPLSVSALTALRRRGVELAWLTHAAGLSSTGDTELDRQLPLPERYDVPARTVQLVQHARERGARVVAVGTSVVRALEGNFDANGRLVAGLGSTALRIGSGFERRVVTGLLSGVHSPGESHYDLLEAFVDAGLLSAAHDHAVSLGLRDHEFGDKMFIDAKAVRVPSLRGRGRAPRATGPRPRARSESARRPWCAA